MKKILKRISIYIFVLMLIFSASSCSLILDTDEKEDLGNYNIQKTLEITLSDQLIFCDTNDDTPNPTPIQAKFYHNGVTQDYAKHEDVASTVNRSVVKIIMKEDGGTAYGSGVIVDIEGGLNNGEYYVLTCHHVIANGGNISICVPDTNFRNEGDADYNENYIFNGYIGGDKQTASLQEVSLVGGDRDADIAVLKLNTANRLFPVNIQVASMPETSNYMIGELKYAQEVFAIGNPTGDLPMTFLSGNISYIDRPIVLDSIGYMEVIQHDCLITHGSSGGGLFNMKGQLIGITNAGSDTYKGMNYAIPYYGADGFMSVAKQLIESSTPTNYGYVQGRWSLGVTITETTSNVKGSSVKVTSIETGSNASGLIEKNDYVLKVEFNGYSEDITSANTFKNAIFTAREYLSLGDKIKITVARQSLEIVP